MKMYQEALLKSKTLADEEFINIFKQFADQVAAWSYLDKESVDYATGVGQPSCLLLLDEGRFQPAVAITKENKGVYYIANIVPREPGPMPNEAYNKSARRFATDFRKYARMNKVAISVSISSENAGLRDIIRSPKAREFFERCIHGYPASYHPLDIKRLDAFICAASRYCRQRVDVDALERYLMKDLNWSREDARWCCRRIEAGLDILAVNKRF